MINSGLLLDEQTLHYDFGEGHVMNTNRIFPAYHLFKNYFLSQNEEFKNIKPKEYNRDYLFLAHDLDYIEVVENLSKSGLGTNLKFGLGTPDNPVWKGMAEVSEFVVKAAVTSADEVYHNEVNFAFVLLGGLHHATKRQASGFCYYNDINVAIHRLKALKDGIKILYLDTDLHHGDGVQFDFYNDPNVVTVSFHESGDYLFPGTGMPDEIGEKNGAGTSINIPFFPFTWDEYYTQTFDDIFPTIFESYQPDYVIWQAGSDGHIRDPLGHLMLTSSTYNHIGSQLRKLAINNMEIPKVLSFGGGGYNPYGNAKSWSNSFAGLTNFQLPTKGLETWVNICKERGIKVDKSLVEEKSAPIKGEIQKIEEGNKNYRDLITKHLSPYFAI